MSDIESRRNNDDLMDKNKDKRLTEDEINFLQIEKNLDPLTLEFSAFLWYKCTLIRIIRMKRDPTCTYTFQEKFLITAFGIRKRKLLLEMIAEMKTVADEKPDHISYVFIELMQNHVIGIKFVKTNHVHCIQ